MITGNFVFMIKDKKYNIWRANFPKEVTDAVNVSSEDEWICKAEDGGNKIILERVLS